MQSPFRLLVAYDGSPCADNMIDDLQNAGIPAKAHVLVVSVAERWLPPPSVYELATTPGLPRGQNQAARLAALGATRIFARHPQWIVEHEGYTGSPARVIGQRATEWNAQLVVVGSLGHSAIERVLIGSTSQKIANEASCSVRVSRGQRAAGDLRLLLACDGRPGSEKAASAIASRSWPQGTAVHLMAAVGHDGPPLGECTLPADHGRVQAMLAPVVEMLSRAGLDVHISIQEGDPKNLIVTEAVRLDAHCIFAGCNDHSLVDRLLLGTISNALISRAPCTVEVVR